MANGTRKPMRQGQQNRRGRGRGRKPQNPLGRNLESNGPDVKIRGNAAHIAEKYATLARDALASGDMVAGESYLQHAEHYNRIIMANQAQQPAPQGENMNGAGRGRDNSQGEDSRKNQPDVAADGNEVIASNRGAANQSVSDQSTPDQSASDRSASGRNAPDQSAGTEPSTAKSGNGADNDVPARRTRKPAKKEASDAKDTDGGDADEKSDEAVT